MKNKMKLLIKLIENYENNLITADSTIYEFNKIANSPIDKFILESYWKSESIEEFVASYSYEEINDWKEIDDERAMNLINEYKENFGEKLITERIIKALEKRYSKTQGSLNEIIYEKTTTEVLSFLKKDTVIRL
ncbi:hypothetical protein R3X25_11550 [Lutibacter sp. TH_r2]|uniref:Uncharacterized protein n=1 Tax=Winogradskyella litoriviva TaxID=1220182 RepID=A0ABX2E8P4_9FLAO|nr:MULTISPECIES: hypothetical protein [Flavobacteriaceae]MDV7187917.1 hypothetical protein [Lutibacter sp. TH_r2]NRD24914.1 hypothetical protein [Winogradskyella litoriviva]